MKLCSAARKIKLEILGDENMSFRLNKEVKRKPVGFILQSKNRTGMRMENPEINISSPSDM